MGWKLLERKVSASVVEISPQVDMYEASLIFQDMAQKLSFCRWEDTRVCAKVNFLLSWQNRPIRHEFNVYWGLNTNHNSALLLLTSCMLFTIPSSLLLLFLQCFQLCSSNLICNPFLDTRAAKTEIRCLENGRSQLLEVWNLEERMDEEAWVSQAKG